MPAGSSCWISYYEACVFLFLWEKNTEAFKPATHYGSKTTKWIWNGWQHIEVRSQLNAFELEMCCIFLKTWVKYLKGLKLIYLLAMQIRTAIEESILFIFILGKKLALYEYWSNLRFAIMLNANLTHEVLQVS